MNKHEVPPPFLALAETIGLETQKDEPTPAMKAARVAALEVREGVIAKQDGEWDRHMAPYRGAAPALADYGPNHPCDRCNHASKYHAVPPRSHCLVADGPKIPGVKATQCWCDGWFPR